MKPSFATAQNLNALRCTASASLMASSATKDAYALAATTVRPTSMRFDRPEWPLRSETKRLFNQRPITISMQLAAIVKSLCA